MLLYENHEQRINTIIGQLEGVKKNVNIKKIRICFASIVQLKAIRSATSSLMNKIIAKKWIICLLEKVAGKKNWLKYLKK
jgi:DNA-binding FrmR family transcriptional regulator